MTWGVHAMTPTGYLSLTNKNAHRCAVYVGKWQATDVRQYFSNAIQWIQGWRRAYTHQLDVTTQNVPRFGETALSPTPPLVFIQLMAGSRGGWDQGQGGSLLKMQMMSNNGAQSTWRLYFVFNVSGLSPWIRIFQPCPQTPTSPNADGLFIYGEDGSVLFDSNRRSLRLYSQVGVEVGKYSDNGASNYRPRYNYSWDTGKGLTDCSVMAPCPNGMYLAASSSWQGHLNIGWQYSGSWLCANWLIMNSIGSPSYLGSSINGNDTYRVPLGNIPGRAFIIQNSNYPWGAVLDSLAWLGGVAASLEIGFSKNIIHHTVRVYRTAYKICNADFLGKREMENKVPFWGADDAARLAAFSVSSV